MLERLPHQDEDLVGRRRELGEIDSAILDAVAGRARALFFTGEPGIGKSRLVEAAAARAESRGASAIFARCWEAGGSPPYWPWTQLARALERRTGTSPAPDLARLSGGLSASEVTLDGVRERFFLGVGAAFRSAAESTPLLLVFEDLHAADPSSLELLRSVVEGAAAARLLVVGTWRDAEARGDEELTRRLDAIAGHGRVLRLEGLGTRDVAAWVERRFATAGIGVVARTLHRFTGGNPLFLEEILALVGDPRALDADALRNFRVPRHIRDVIGRRLDVLPASSRAILATASVIGSEFDGDVLDHLAGADGVADALRAPLEAGIVRAEGDVPGRFAFAHALFREVLYQALPAPERLELHARIGEALETRGAARSSHADLAHHFVQAAPVRGRERGLRHAAAAGREAMAQLAWESAARHFEDALALAELPPEEPAASRCALALELGEATWASGAFERSKRAFRKAARLARETGEPEALARAALGTSGHAVFLDMGAGGVDEPRTGLLAGALERLSASDSPLRARVLARLCAALSLGPEVERRRALAEEAEAMARRLGDDETLADVLHAASWGTWSPDTLDERLPVSAEVLALAIRTGRPGLAMLTRFRRLHHCLEAADRESAALELEELRRLAESLPQTFYRWVVELAEAVWATVDGDFDAAESHAKEALRIGREGENPNAFRLFGIQSVFVLRERARLDEVLPLVGEVVAALPDFAAWRSALAWTSAELGHRREARRELDVLARDGFARVPRDLYWLAALWGAAETAISLEDRRRAERLYAHLAPFENRCLVVYSGAFGGAIARLLGALAALLDRHDAAAGHFATARAIHERMGARSWAARSRFDEARALLRRGRAADRKRAEALLVAARETAASLGMTALDEAIESLRKGRPGRRRVKSPNVFRLDGEFWTVRWQGKRATIPDAKGLRYLAVLLASPGQDLHVVEFAGPEAGGAAAPRAGARTEGMSASAGLGDAGEALDAKAAASYRARLRELEAAREGAPEDLREIREEIAFLERELAASRGFGGRRRPAADASDRARKAVTSRIRHALTRIESVHPRLARHLDASLRLGTWCCYAPRQPPSWEL